MVSVGVSPSVWVCTPVSGDRHAVTAVLVTSVGHGSMCGHMKRTEEKLGLFER